MSDEINVLELIIQKQQEMLVLYKLDMIDKKAINDTFTDIFDKVKKGIERYHRLQEVRTMRVSLPKSWGEEDESD